MRLLEPSAADEAELVEHLTVLINDVYATAEAGLWQDGATRTTAPELAGLIRAGQMAVTSRHGRIVGSVRVHDVADDTSEFGMLVAAPDQRGTGIGRDHPHLASMLATECDLTVYEKPLGNAR